MKRIRSAAVAALALFSLASASLVTIETEAASAATGSVHLVGHGWGHGRGMGQYGALGYAINSNWNYSQILQHYYSNTSFGAGVANSVIKVLLSRDADGQDLIVSAPNPFSVNGVSRSGAVRIRRTGVNNFAIDGGPNCGGPWSQVATSAGAVTIQPPSGSPGDNSALMLTRCTVAGSRAYRGSLTYIEDANMGRTINNVRLEDYIRGVVPRESPASWGDLGGGKGMEALKAQTVAARSYASSENRSSKYKTCDSTSCQVYGGAFLNGAHIEDHRTDQAILATLGKVRRFSNGNIARTEFSSSTGGYTAGGTFPATIDAGDSVSNNHNHNWSTDVSVASIQARYPSIGTFSSISVTSRNGLGDLGGRVLSLNVIGSSGSVSVSGDSFRIAFGLKSNWFAVSGQNSGGVAGYWLLASDGGIFSRGHAPYYGSMTGRFLAKPVVGMTPLSNGNGYWLVASDGGIFAFGDARFYGSMGGRHLNRPVIGMASTPTGRGYWLFAGDGGIFSFGDARFYGSTGSIRLNKPIVGMTSTPSGRGYWMVASDGGIFSFGDAKFKGSTGSIRLAQPVVGMARPNSDRGYWLVAADGGIFSFGNAGYYGSLPAARIVTSVAGMDSTATGRGYNMVSRSGSVYSFGDAPNFGGAQDAVPGWGGRIIAIKNFRD